MIDGETPLGALDPKEVIDTISSQTPADKTSFEDIKKGNEFVSNVMEQGSASKKKEVDAGEETPGKPGEEVGGIVKETSWRTIETTNNSKPASTLAKEVADAVSDPTSNKPGSKTAKHLKQSKEYLENARKLYEAEQKDVEHMGKSPFQDVVLPEGIEVTKASVPVEILDKPIKEIGEIAKRNGWGTGKMLKDAKPVSRAVKDVTATPLPTTNQPSK